MTLPPLTLETITIGLEIIVLLVTLLATRRKKYMYGLAFAFAVSVFYDLAHYYAFDVPARLFDVLLMLAALGALYTVWKIFRRRIV